MAGLASRSTALVVDDSPTIRHQLRAMLSPLAETTCVGTVDEAMQKALACPPDIIVSDVVMAPHDGYELLRRVRAAPSLRDVPFILLTGQDDPDGRAAGLESGADDYLAKPVRPRELLARVQSLLRLVAARAEILRQKSEISAANEALILAQQQLIDSEKLASVGTVASGIAHEINNPLAFVMSGFGQLVMTAKDLAADPPPPTDERALLAAEVSEIDAEVRSGLERIRAVVTNLASLSQSDQERGEYDVTEEVMRALAIARPKLAKVEVVTDLVSGCVVTGPAGFVTQAVQAVLANAADALEGQPKARVTVRVERLGLGVTVTVENNGPNIPTSILPRIFEPFFTTKTAGVGAGLGLSTCKSLLHRLGGTVKAESVPDGPTRFVLTVPLRAPAHDRDFSAGRREAEQAAH